MPEKVSLASAEKIYLALEYIYRGAGIIKECHGVQVFPFSIEPPPVGSDCRPRQTPPPTEVYAALQDLETRVQNVVKEYAAFYSLDLK